jgi:serine/threonine protein kinase
MGLSAGDRVGRYEILAALGAGGMGEVYRALDTRLKREVALKILPAGLVTDADRRRRFLVEAQSAAALSHPRIATVYDVDDTEGFCYLAMELVAGAPLTDRLRSGPLPAADALALAVEIGDGLACAHARGIVHRDVKPANVMMGPDGHVKLIDFGLAKLLEPGSDETRTDLATRAGRVLGTPAYMSPEQARGADVDARADIFSFGLLLYEALTGQRPFDRGSWPDTIAAVLRDPVPPLPAGATGLAPGALSTLQRLLDRCLAKDAAGRPTSMAEVVGELDAIRRMAESGGAHSGSPAADDASIVVLPFDNLSPDPDNAYFADGLTEEIIADLSRVEGLRVISRTSAMRYRGTSKSVPEIAAELRVRHVLEGSVRKAGGQLRVTAQLIDAPSDAHVWAEKFNGTTDDVFDLQERISRRIVEGTSGRFGAPEVRRAVLRSTTDPRVHEAWLRAMHEGRTYTQENVERGFRIAEEAVAHFGEHALLHAVLGYLNYVAYDAGMRYSASTLDAAQAHSGRAIALHPELSQAHLAMGLVHYKRGNLLEWAQSTRQAVRLERGGDALAWHALALIEAGLGEQGRSLAEEAVSRDPFNLFALIVRAFPDLNTGDFGAVLERCRDAILRVGADVPFAVWWLAQAEDYAGHREAAIPLYEKVEAMQVPIFSGASRLARLTLNGDREAALALLDAEPLRQMARTHEYAPIVLANNLARIGEIDEALTWIDQSISWTFVETGFHRFNPHLEPVRRDPRFDGLMRKALERRRAFLAAF